MIEDKKKDEPLLWKLFTFTYKVLSDSRSLALS